MHKLHNVPMSDRRGIIRDIRAIWTAEEEGGEGGEGRMKAYECIYSTYVYAYKYVHAYVST